MLFAFSRAASALCLLVLTSAVQAAPASLETRSLKAALAANLSLPPAAPLADEAFSRRARLRDVQLSPDGTWIAYVDNNGKNAKLMLRNLLTQEAKQLLPSVGRAEAHWSADSQLLFLDSGDGLSLVRLKDGSSEQLMAFDPKLRQQYIAMAQNSALVDEFDGKSYRLSRVAPDGKRTMLYTGPRPLRGSLTDEHGELTFVLTTDEAWNQFVLRHNDGRWQEVMRCKPLKPCSLVNADARRLRLQAIVDDDRRGLVELDLASGKRRTLHTDPLAVSDLRQVVQSASQQQAMFAVYDMPTRRNVALLSKYQQAALDIAKRFPDSNITINPGNDAPRWLLTERGARLHHERYWLYERQARSFSELLQAERQLGEPLAETSLAHKIPLHYRASDGMLAHGYLSLPPGKDPSQLGLITMVHGGPWGKFDSEYTGLVQLLVNRGFAVFQPNFRASTGYGEQYKRAPAGDFGNGRVQADLIDGVQWLLANGVGQRDRLAIIGDSFGGYATLLALTFTPDMFRFGMATSPPTDFARTLQATAVLPGTIDTPPLSTSLQDVGIDLADAAMIARLVAQSPAANASKLARPLLIMAGGKDDRVDIASVTDYVARLQAAGKPVSLYVDDDEGHTLRKPQSRAAYLYLLQSMLHRHLGGPAPAAPPAELATVIQQNMKVNAALTP